MKQVCTLIEDKFTAWSWSHKDSESKDFKKEMSTWLDNKNKRIINDTIENR